MRTLSLAALQTAPVPRDPEATLEPPRRAASAAPSATVPHAQLLVLPELHLSAPPRPSRRHSGYAGEVAVEIPGPLTEALGGIAAESEIWLVPGSVYELASDGAIHNTALVISPATGSSSPRYRKVFPWQPHEAPRRATAS